MKKLKRTFVFGIIFLIVLIIDIIFYKNIDKLVPTMDKKIYSFENISKKSNEDFIIDMYELAMTQNSSITELENLDEILNNEVIYNLIKNNIFRDCSDSETNQWLIYSFEMSNTIYGNLKSIVLDKDDAFYVIIYSEDMKKIFYINEKILYGILNSSESITDSDLGYPENANQYIDNLISENDKIELINKVKSAFSTIIKDSEFNPETIMKNANCYVLKDTERKVTVYYSVEEEKVTGFYLGFDQ